MEPKFVVRMGGGYAAKGTNPNAVTIYRQGAKWFARFQDAADWASKCGGQVYRAYYGQETEYPALADHYQ